MALIPPQTEENYETTYRREYVTRQLDITAEAMSATPKSASVSPYVQKVRRRGRRHGNAAGSLMLPGRSMTVGPAPSLQRVGRSAPDPADRVSETLQIDMGDADHQARDCNRWLIAKLPEIVETYCRQQEAPPAVDADRPPVRRRIRINVSSGPPWDAPELGPDQESIDKEFVLDGAGLLQVRRSRPRHRCRDPPPGGSSSVALHEELRPPREEMRPPRELRPPHEELRPSHEEMRPPRELRPPHEELRPSHEEMRPPSESWLPRPAPAADPASTADLVRKVLEEMFGARRAADVCTPAVPACQATGADAAHAGSAVDTATLAPAATPSGSNVVASSSTACQTSPRLAHLRAAEAAVQTDTKLAPDAPPGPPRAPATSRRILETLTESNRLLCQMTEFFRRAELTDLITRRVEPPEVTETAAGWEEAEHSEVGRGGDTDTPLDDRVSERAGDERGRYGADEPGGGGTWSASDDLSARIRQISDGQLRQCSSAQFSHCRWKAHGALDARCRSCSDGEVDVRLRQCAADGWQQPSEPPHGDSSSPPSTARSQLATSPAPLSLHSVGRPYRPLGSPPPPRQPAGSSERLSTASARLAWDSSPAGDRLPCSHRLADDPDSTDILLNYDPWEAIENDFKTLLS